jgi:hypothetical protein
MDDEERTLRVLVRLGEKVDWVRSLGEYLRVYDPKTEFRADANGYVRIGVGLFFEGTPHAVIEASVTVRSTRGFHGTPHVWRFGFYESGVYHVGIRLEPRLDEPGDYEVVVFGGDHRDQDAEGRIPLRELIAAPFTLLG